MTIKVKCQKGYNGIKTVELQKGTVTFETIGTCLFTSFEIEDTNGNQPGSFNGPHTKNNVWPSPTVSYEYSGARIPDDGYLFHYMTNAMTGNAVSVNTGVAVRGTAIVSIGVPTTMGDGSGVIKNK